MKIDPFELREVAGDKHINEMEDARQKCLMEEIREKTPKDKRGEPLYLYCPCPRCNPKSMSAKF